MYFEAGSVIYAYGKSKLKGISGDLTGDNILLGCSMSAQSDENNSQSLYW